MSLIFTAHVDCCWFKGEQHVYVIILHWIEVCERGANASLGVWAGHIAIKPKIMKVRKTNDDTNKIQSLINKHFYHTNVALLTPTLTLKVLKV